MATDTHSFDQSGQRPGPTPAPAAATAPSMRWSLKLARVSGIDIFVHWTFLILVIWVFVAYAMQGATLLQSLRGLALILAVFACIVLHELGHALTAQRFNINTRDITLLPIGGLAKLERIPENPYEELMIVLAGPAVNLVIAAVLFLLIWAHQGFTTNDWPVNSFASRMMSINVMLMVFNLIPAFPMDGGRILRALLAQRMDYLRATQIAARAGQVIAVLFGVWGLAVANPFLVFIALFVYSGAHQEYEYAMSRALLHGIPVRAAMITEFTHLHVTDPLSLAVEKLLHGAQEDFPVLDGDKVAGVLTRNQLIHGLANRGPGIPVGDVMDRNCPCVQDNASLEDIVQQMREAGCTAEPVLHEDQLVGLLTLEHVAELAEIRSALRGTHS